MYSQIRLILWYDNNNREWRKIVKARHKNAYVRACVHVYMRTRDGVREGVKKWREGKSTTTI